ncbi:riboflavin-specific deaminase [Histoplasma capsulatum G186AR]|uniref:2,5-diamino-6-ribosylamino-4(3H)-pyrimidinone 5'-phosphate reductase n=2 Tax=Ajellomyces capsulatus TaxID=5037 RepID=C0NYU5_AJECG|nr:riboflavin-specific deaminase [Histoplasma capsulatum G186AR]EEH03385.1 riboflavin-specific deaminase [Histoplasma capsulatum G186AR]KAG5295796.1 riboflavin-specific deaminase [Histoplasma capsulatum]QSS73778.1 riboflavin-specific deaminase [Histoplasma capsulatum G186AR]
MDDGGASTASGSPQSRLSNPPEQNDTTIQSNVETENSPKTSPIDEDVDMDDAEDDDSRLQNDIKAQVEAEPERQPSPSQSAEPTSHPQPANNTNTDFTTPTEQQNAEQVIPPAPAPAPAGPAYYSLFSNPPNLGWIRQVLFELKDSVEMSVEEFRTYWPFIDNVWVKQRSNSTKDGLTTTDYYMCRLRRATCRPNPSRPLPEGKRARKKVIREGNQCNVQIKVVKFEGAYSAVTITRTPGSSRTHSHDLDHIDKVKRNSGLIEYCRKEAEKGYLPSSIYAKFREEPDKLLVAGGKFFSVTDVRNVSAKWRALHPDVKLREHEGYHYQQGHGIMRIQGPVLEPRNGAVPPPLPPPPLESQNARCEIPPDALPFPSYSLDFLQPYLPRYEENRQFPFVTLTYASSMDSKVSLFPGVQTALSGTETKLMTHYLRSRHDAILIGVGTAMVDNPGLNCRLTGSGGFGGLGKMWQPRPIIVDPTGRWPADPECRLLKTAKEGKGKAPWVVVSPGANIQPAKVLALKNHGGDYLRIVEYNQSWRLRWEAILRALGTEGITSVMIEGGATVISELLNPEYVDFVDSLIITVAPTFLGQGGVGVSPDAKKDNTGKPISALNPRDIKWQPLGQDVVMCGKIRVPPAPQPILSGIETVAQQGGEGHDAEENAQNDANAAAQGNKEENAENSQENS